jgi:hypothetical protein
VNVGDIVVPKPRNLRVGTIVGIHLSKPDIQGNEYVQYDVAWDYDPKVQRNLYHEDIEPFEQSWGFPITDADRPAKRIA